MSTCDDFEFGKINTLAKLFRKLRKILTSEITEDYLEGIRNERDITRIMVTARLASWLDKEYFPRYRKRWKS